jgi:hypothetical protein
MGRSLEGDLLTYLEILRDRISRLQKQLAYNEVGSVEWLGAEAKVQILEGVRVEVMSMLQEDEDRRVRKTRELPTPKELLAACRDDEVAE